MKYYHGTPVGGLTVLQPSVTKYFGKPMQVCMTSLRAMALLYLIDNFEYTYGYDRNGRIYYEEYYPDSLEKLYRGKSGYLYECEAGEYQTTKIPNEYVSNHAVRFISCAYIPDAYEAIMDAVQKGEIDLVPYAQMSEGTRRMVHDWYAREILEKELWKTPGSYAAYLKTNYPEIWSKTILENGVTEDVCR